MQEKDKIRKENKRRVMDLSTSLREEKEEIAFSKLEENEHFLKADKILLFHALSDEINTEKFLNKWEGTKTFFLPIVKGDDLIIKAFSSTKNLKVGAYGILEPTTGIETSRTSLDLLIIPGTAFDGQGNRMGRGKGFYDRLLKNNKTYKIGICYLEQIIDKVPCEAHDIPMDEVIYA